MGISDFGVIKLDEEKRITISKERILFMFDDLG
jgi:hypothetical protein